MDLQSDSTLVEAALNGDRHAYGCLFKRHERSVQAVALRVLGDHHAAQDAVQDAFITAYKKLGSLRNGSSFGPWVRKIARRQAISIGRRTRSNRVVKQTIADAVVESSDGRIDEPDSRLLNAVIRLPKHEREVIMLHYFDGHTTKTISEMTGRSRGTVTMQLSRAHAHLRKWLKGNLI